MRHAQRSLVSLLGASVFIGLLLLVLGLSVGSAGWYSPWALLDLDALPWDIVWQMRAPRAVGAALVGALLGLSGAIAQGLFRNPLAEPYLLGSSSGAALALALALACGLSGALVSGESGAWGGWWNRMGWTGAAFVGAVGGVALTLLLARGAAHTMRLLLAGVVVGVVLGAITQLLMLWSSPVWRAMQSFMLGSTALLGWQACGVMCAALVVALPMALMLSRVLDALSLGESTAQTLGVPLGWPRLCLVGVMTLATAVVVAQVGLIAFVGLAAPHLVRRWSGAQHVRLLCLATSMGALLLMAADTVARIVLAPQELPVGVVTAVLGGGYLLFLLWRKGVGP